MINKNFIKQLYNEIASGNKCQCAFPVDLHKFRVGEAKKVNTKSCDALSKELKKNIFEYRNSFLNNTEENTPHIEIVAITDMVCNAVSKKQFEKYQIVFFSGLFTLMSYRLIVSQMTTCISAFFKKLNIADFEKNLAEVLKLSYCLGFWVYFKKSHINIKNVVMMLNNNDMQNYLHALGGAMLFIYLHEVGHIQLGHHELNTLPNGKDAENIEYEADKFAIESIKHSLRPAMLVNALLVFEMINEFELYALRSTKGYPLTYRRIENIKNIVELDTEKDLQKIIDNEISKSDRRYTESKFHNAITGKVALDEAQRKIDFEGLLPKIAECEKGFSILCDLYKKSNSTITAKT